MKKIILSAIAMVTGFTVASAQMVPNKTTSGLNNLFAVSWEIAVPAGNDLISATSLAGGKVEYRKFLPDKPLSFGLSLSWNSYEQYYSTRTISYDNDTKAITTDMDRVVYTTPVAALAHYYFNYGQAIMPYAGIGLGAQYSEQNIYYNIFLSSDYNWGFLARPELGVLIAPGGQRNWGVLLGASYSYATNKNSTLKINDLKNISFNIGLFLNN